MLRSSFHPRTFTFGFDARTSRGSMTDKHSWFLKVWDDQDPDVCGWGECGPLPGLSPEDFQGQEPLLQLLTDTMNQEKWTIDDFIGPNDNVQKLHKNLVDHFPAFLFQNSSLIFATETAFLDLRNGGRRVIFENNFSKGVPIAINGLVWMGGLDFMLQQVEGKIREGFTCIKLKIGGLDFEKELDIVQYVRRKHYRSKIVLRLDANGAFKTDEVVEKIQRLAPSDIHSLEQPLKVGSEELAELCQSSPIPIALDEELIGVSHRINKELLLDRIKPAYLILKPTLHGGLSGCAEWIELAESRGMGWWITSALESNIGLNAVSQFVAEYPIEIHQGLGTGAIYTNNIASPLVVENGFLRYDPLKSWGKPD